jgi:hypothetical protein
MAISGKYADLSSNIAAVERSQITIGGVSAWPARLRRRFDLPADFEAVDIAVLDWIVAKGLGAARFVLM